MKQKLVLGWGRHTPVGGACRRWAWFWPDAPAQTVRLARAHRWRWCERSCSPGYGPLDRTSGWRALGHLAYAGSPFFDAQSSQVLVIGGRFRPDLQEAGTASAFSPPGETGAIGVFAVAAEGHLIHSARAPTAFRAHTAVFVPERRALPWRCRCMGIAIPKSATTSWSERDFGAKVILQREKSSPRRYVWPRHGSHGPSDRIATGAPAGHLLRPTEGCDRQ